MPLGRPTRLAASLLALATLAVGCAPERTLVIRSIPAGATVRLDDQKIGVTPLRHPFYHYGTRQVVLYKEGCHTHSERIELVPPWYARFPLDFVSEVLLPFGWHDTRRLEVQLEHGEELVSLPTLRSVFERADILRSAGPDGPRNLPPPRVRLLERVEDEEPEPSSDPRSDPGPDPRRDAEQARP